MLLGLAALLALAASPAGAHASLDATTPSPDGMLASPPELVVLRFTERVDPGLGGVKVIAPDGSRVDRGRELLRSGGTVVEVPVDIEIEGTYTVAWAVVSADSHNISGSFLFSVGRVTFSALFEEPDRTPLRLLAGASRGLAFAGVLVLVGTLAFLVLVAPEGAGTLAGGPGRLLSGSAVGAALGALGVLVTQVALASGRPLADSLGLLGDAVTNTRFGTLSGLRIVLAVVALGLVQVRLRTGANPISLLVAAPVCGLVVLPALAGHAWTTDPRWLAVVNDALHVAATGVWMGGLVALLVLSRPLDEGSRAVVARFSGIALVAAALVVATGTASSYLQARSLGALTSTDYGRLLLVKIAVVLALLTVGWVNRRKLLALLPERTTLFTLVRVEIAMAVVVVAVTAALVNRPPARDETTGSFEAVVALSGDDGAAGELQIEVEPARRGVNDIHLYFLDERGLPSAVDAVEVTVATGDVPPRKVSVTPVTTDHQSAYGVSLPTSGTWSIVVTAVRKGSTAAATVELEIP